MLCQFHKSFLLSTVWKMFDVIMFLNINSWSLKLLLIIKNFQRKQWTDYTKYKQNFLCIIKSNDKIRRQILKIFATKSFIIILNIKWVISGDEKNIRIVREIDNEYELATVRKWTVNNKSIISVWPWS